ncbi:MAG: MFS transporter, partial [Anaerolineae bacterium]|nr:MFS transporter [Anaerolineae bacterium]
QATGSFALFMGLFVLASLGSGAFHPLGTKHAADESGARAATGTAIFFGFGQTGLALGPVLAGVILQFIGIEGIYGLALLAIPILIFMFYGMRQAHVDLHILPLATNQPALTTPPEAVRWGAIGVLALLIGLRSWAFLGTVAFLPKIFQDMNWSSTAYGLITGTFWFASALTGAVVGNLADRWGRRPVVFATMLLGSIPLFFLPLNSGWPAFPLAVISGGLLGASHSILVVIAQDLLPLRKAFSSGITLGFLFGVGAIATWGIGTLADAWGLTLLIQIGAGIGVLAALLALFLPKTREIISTPPIERVPA